MISLHRDGPDRDLTDGDIVRYVDRECAPDEARRIAAHLVACDSCRRRVEVLERRLGVLSSLLSEADFAPGERASGAAPRNHAALKAAAIMLVTLGVGVSFTPLRAWVARTLSDEADRSSPALLEESGVVPGYGIVSFAVVGPSLTIEVANGQAGGVLYVRLGDARLASARVEQGDGSEELVVLPETLRVVSSRTSVAHYRVVVPASLASVTVRIGESAPRLIPVRELGGSGASIDLRR